MRKRKRRKVKENGHIILCKVRKRRIKRESVIGGG